MIDLEPVLWSVNMSSGHIDIIMSMADEHDIDRRGSTIFRDVPIFYDILIDSSGATGWTICVGFRTGLVGTAADLEALCQSLVAVGRKREREIAGRIKMRALKKGAPAEDWAGEPPKPKRSEKRSIEDVARAWKQGSPLRAGNVRTNGRDLYSWNLRIGRTHAGKKIAIDYRRKISDSTSRHVGVAIRYADRTEAAP